MSAPMDDQLEAALADLRAQREKINGFRATTADRKISATSQNRMVSVTVDSQGKLVDLALKGNRYRQLPPAELSALIVQTVREAQDTASKETMAAALALLPEGFGIPGARRRKRDLDEMIEDALRMTEQPIFADEAGPGEPNEAA